ncbi:hypothetical protein GE061_000627 [Apolygus lucorum]|uniref:SLC26A/SulP transporter domain-containing protein n=1 Tax=Apolygus lucorum TaxID=248454 RepID=A0A8S9Y4V7_APOLU|nr:hypothetical protein GE061_000627 [Apolygus lucorum]
MDAGRVFSSRKIAISVDSVCLIRGRRFLPHLAQTDLKSNGHSQARQSSGLYGEQPGRRGRQGEVVMATAWRGEDATLFEDEHSLTPAKCDNPRGHPRNHLRLKRQFLEDDDVELCKVPKLPRQYTMEEHGAKIRIDRKVCLQHSHTVERDVSPTRCMSTNCKPKKFIKSMFPAIGWLCTYQWKEWLAKDLIAGATVAIMNVPQGMAYALLGNVPPVVGIYMALFPVLVYALLGTSKHVSMGSFAVVCLMAGNVVTRYATPPELIMTTGNITATANIGSHYTPVQVASAVALLVGIYQLILYVLRFGLLCTLLSETLVSGFTAGAAIHVLTSQLKDVFGIKVEHFHGPLKLIRIYGDIFSKLHTTNLAAVVVSAITVVVLIANNEFLKPLAAKWCIIPVPIELIVVLCGTLVSTYGGIYTTYGLKVVGDIPVGLPEPTLPPFDLFSSI